MFSSLREQNAHPEDACPLFLYASGLRFLECLHLRVKDLVFDRKEIVVRESKGAKDRITMMPEVTTQPLRAQLQRVRELHEADTAHPQGCRGEVPQRVRSLHTTCAIPSPGRKKPGETAACISLRALHTTMVNTHVLNRRGRSVHSPDDLLYAPQPSRKNTGMGVPSQSHITGPDEPTNEH